MQTSQRLHALMQLPNIGKMLAEQLIQIGIETPEQLRELGVEKTFIRIRAIDPGACLHKLYAIAGAIQGVRKPELSEAEKEELRLFFMIYREYNHPKTLPGIE